jgi:hypothetical protein
MRTLCECGCREYASEGSRFIRGHNRSKKLLWLQFLEEHTGKHFCHCGCKGAIQIRKWHQWDGIPLYISGHNGRGQHRVFTEEWCRHISEARIGMKMSEDFCKKMSMVITGENNPNWRGGVTPEDVMIRHSNEYVQWVKEVKKRDNHTCQYCGTKRKLQIHHIKMFVTNPELRMDINNGITLCKKCHESIKGIESEHEQTLTMIATQKMIVNW